MPRVAKWSDEKLAKELSFATGFDGQGAKEVAWRSLLVSEQARRAAAREG